MRYHNLFVLIAALFLLASCAPADQNVTVTETADNDSVVEIDQMQPEQPAAGDETPDKVFQLTGENFRFLMDGEENPTLRVKQGDLVRIEFTSASGFHDWVIDEFDARTQQVSAPDSTFVEFVADTTGEFAYYCSVGQHRANGMEGLLIVE